MNNNLFRNSYQILGLENTATQKDINKRSKEILNLLAIDENPRYDLDLELFGNLRTANQVREAAQRLLTPKNRIKDYFFWFDSQDSTDENALRFIKDLKNDEARGVWREGIEKSSSKANFYKKNLAILDLFLLLGKDDKDLLKESLSLWSDVISSDSFWNGFGKLFKLTDDLNSDQSVIDDFKKEATSLLSDIYADLGKKHSSKDFISEYVKVFGGKGEQLDKTVKTPIFQKINEALTELNSIKFKADEGLSEGNLNEIKKAISSIQNAFNELIDTGIYEESETKVLRDKAAEEIRRIALGFNNELIDYKTAFGFINISSSLAGTSLLKDKVNKDLEIIESNVADLDLIDVTELIQKQKLDDAINLIDEKLKDKGLQRLTRTRLNQIKKNLSERIKTIGKPVGSAPPLFTLWGFGLGMFRDTLCVTALFFPILPLARYTVDQEGGRYTFYGRLPLTNKQKWWLVIGLIIGAIYLFSILASPSTTTSSSDSNSVTVGDYTCSQDISGTAKGMLPTDNEKNNVYSEGQGLTSLKTQIDSTYVDHASQYSVDSYNSLVDQYNSNRIQYNSDLNSYNKKINDYNSYLETNCQK